MNMTDDRTAEPDDIEVDGRSVCVVDDDELHDDSALDPRERRRSVRRPTLEPASISLEEWSSKINCTVHNISDGGARIRLERPLALPEYFLIKIGTAGPLRRVRKCWHINDEIGVEFCEATI